MKGSYQHESVGHVTPGPDGRVMFTASGQRSPPKGKVIGEREGGGGGKPRAAAFVPSPPRKGRACTSTATLDLGFEKQRRHASLAAKHWGLGRQEAGRDTMSEVERWPD